MMLIGKVVLGVLLASAAASAGPPASQPAELSDAQLRELVAQLNDRSYEVRESATHRLARLDFASAGRIVTLYKSAAAPEQKLRIKWAVRAMYLAAQEAGRMPEGFLGVAHIQVGGDQVGVQTPVALVNGVVANSPAERAGLKEGDYIVKLNGQPLDARPGHQFSDKVRLLKPGDTITLSVQREDKKLELKATLSARAKFAVARDNMADQLASFSKYWHDTFDLNDPVSSANELPIIIQGGQLIIDKGGG